MKHSLTFLTLVTLPWLAAANTSSVRDSESLTPESSILRPQSGPCSRQDTITAITMTVLNKFLNKTDSIAVRIRQEFALPATASVAVLESDTLVCRNIRRVLDSIAADPKIDTTREMFIARVDTMFVVNDLLSPRPSSRESFRVLNRNYRSVGGWK